MDEVWCEGGLHDTDPEAVREATCAPTVESTGSVLPAIGDCLVVAAIDFHIRAVGPVCCELETGSVDDAIEFEFFAIGDDAFLGNVRDADTFCVDQMSVGVVEGLEIFVVEARTNASQYRFRCYRVQATHRLHN